MSLLCRFTNGADKFLLDPNLIVKVTNDEIDGACLFLKNGEEYWVDGEIDDLQRVINAGRTLDRIGDD